MNLLNTQFCPTLVSSCLYEYLPQHSAHENPQLFFMYNARHDVPQSFTTDKCNMFFDSEQEGERFWTEMSVAFIESNVLDTYYACSADLLVLFPYIFTLCTSYIMLMRHGYVMLQE